jgi:hypothetical protein
MQALRPAPRFHLPVPVSMGYAGAAPCTRAGGQPPAPPLGPFHFPKPLEIQDFCSAQCLGIMPLPRYSGATVSPYQVQKLPAQCRLDMNW